MSLTATYWQSAKLRLIPVWDVPAAGSADHLLRRSATLDDGFHGNKQYSMRTTPPAQAGNCIFLFVAAYSGLDLVKHGVPTEAKS